MAFFFYFLLVFCILLWHVLNIIVFWINSLCVLDFLSNSTVDSVRIFMFPSTWFIFICFGCYFIFHPLLAWERSTYHFCSFWTSRDHVCGLACDVWHHMGNCHEQLEVIHSTRYLLIISLRDFFSLGLGQAQGLKWELKNIQGCIHRGILIPGLSGNGTTQTA